MSPPTKVARDSLSPAVDAIRADLSRIPGVRHVVLFGSVARGRGTPRSDIDLLVDCSSRSRTRVNRALFAIHDRYGIWPSPVFVSYDDLSGSDRQFLESVLRDGTALIGSLPPLTVKDLKLQPMRLVSYWADHLSPTRRARLLRELDGYSTRKRVGRRVYESRGVGFLGRCGGWRTGRGSMAVPERDWPDLDELFRRYRVRRTAIAIWAQAP